MHLRERTKIQKFVFKSFWLSRVLYPKYFHNYFEEYQVPILACRSLARALKLFLARRGEKTLANTSEMLQLVKKDPDMSVKVVMGDETWASHSSLCSSQKSGF